MTANSLRSSACSPTRRRLLGTVYPALCLAASLLIPEPGWTLELFDFEPPFLLDPTHTIKDHSVIRIDGVWHCFYIRGDDSNGTATEDEIGHAISEDLLNWTVLDPAITAGPSAWEARNVWAPHVIPTPGSTEQWTMFYTGATAQVVQRMGLAICATPSLGLWQKSGNNPVLQPDSTLYEWGSVQTFSAFRDPFYFFQDGQHHVLNTALLRDATLPAGRRGAVHHAVSNDLVTWTELPPLATHNGPDNLAWHEIESVQLRAHDGLWHLFFTETNTQGVRHVASAQMDAGWDFNQSVTIDAGTAAEVTPLDGETYLFTRHIASYHMDQTLFWVLRTDSLRFDPNTGDPIIIKTNPLGDDWPVRTGTAFLAVPTFGDNSLERGELPTDPVGNGYVSSSEFNSGPLSGLGGAGIQLGGGATGTMKSRTFPITGDYIRLRVGGGDDPLCFVALVDAVEDTILHQARGAGVPTLSEVLWDVQPHQGRAVYVWIEDASTNEDGYINVDHIEEIYEPSGVPPTRRPAATLLPNRPNPFNPRTELLLRLETPGWVELSVHDARGRLVRKLAAERLGPGRHARVWTGTDDQGRAVASGVYSVVLRIDGEIADRRAVTLVR